MKTNMRIVATPLTIAESSARFPSAGGPSDRRSEEVVVRSRAESAAGHIRTNAERLLAADYADGNRNSPRPQPYFKDFWPELAGHKQPLFLSIVGDAIQCGTQRFFGKRRHARFQSRQIDPAGDATGIRLNDCDSILPLNIGVDLAVDELQLVQIFEGPVAFEHFEAAELAEVLGI